jgi:hypothetical protein
MRDFGETGAWRWDLDAALVAAVEHFRFVFAYTLFMPPDQRHRVYMSFQDRHGWQCQFLEADLQTPLPRRLCFASSSKIVELVERGGGVTDLESHLMLEQGISMGRGGTYLNLSEETVSLS